MSHCESYHFYPNISLTIQTKCTLTFRSRPCLIFYLFILPLLKLGLCQKLSRGTVYEVLIWTKEMCGLSHHKVTITSLTQLVSPESLVLTRSHNL